MTSNSTRERLVEAAIDLLHVHAYPAVGVQAICESAGVRKGSFYHFFGSKEDLAITAVDEAWARYRTLVVEPAIATGDPIPTAEAESPCLPGSADGGRVPHGCMFCRLAASVTEQEPRLQQRLGDLFGEWADMLGGGSEGWATLADLQGRLVIGFALPEGVTS